MRLSPGPPLPPKGQTDHGMYMYVVFPWSPEAGGLKLPEAKKKEAAADISEGWDDDEEWEVSETMS